jgi:soluble lytic murein transglycosylase-like protein
MRQFAFVVALYAHALQYFNPSLPADRAAMYARVTIREADRQGLDARLLVALIAVESSWRERAVSSAGARGLGQLMPATAAALRVDPDDPLDNIAGAARQLRGLLARYAALDRTDRYLDALAAYNAGTGAVERYGGVPPYAETRAYVQRVIRLWSRLSGNARSFRSARPLEHARSEDIRSEGARSPGEPFR